MSQETEEMEVDDRQSSSEESILKTPRSRPQENSPQSPAPDTEDTPLATRLRRRSRRRESAVINLFSNSKLFTCLKENKTPLEQLADEWITSYKANQTVALANLLELFVTTAGSSTEITPEMLEHSEFHEMVDLIETTFGEDTDDFPLTFKTKEFRDFPENFAEFVEALILTCGNSLIYNGHLLNNIVGFLSHLSDTNYRALRQTATLAGLKVMTAMVEINRQVRNNLDITYRQITVELNKPPKDKNPGLLENLNTKQEEFTENLEVLKEHMDHVYQHIFLKRTIDFFPEIRTMCHDEFSVWIDKDTTTFPDNLDFLERGLYDDNKIVRLKAIGILQKTCVLDVLKPKLEEFLKKTIPRIIVMTCDKNLQVCVEAVNLLSLLVMDYSDCMEYESMEHVFNLLRAKHRPLAQATAELLKVCCTDGGNDAARVGNAGLFVDLLSLFDGKNYTYYAGFVVDAFFDGFDLVQDWPVMTHHLLNDSDLDLYKVAWFVLSCVIEAATGKVPDDREPQKKKFTAKEQKSMKRAKRKLTEHFIPIIPVILERFHQQPDILAPLLQIPQYFDLDLYTQCHQEDKLKVLIEKIKVIVKEHTDGRVLEAAVKTLEIFCLVEHAKAQFCDTEREIIIDSIVEEFKTHAEDCESLFGHDTTPDQDMLDGFTVSLRKVAIFYSCHDLNGHQLWRLLCRYLELIRTESQATSAECTRRCILACYFSLLWSLSSLKSDTEQDEKHARALKRRLQRFMETMRSFLTAEVPTSTKEEAYKTICDLLMAFRRRLEDSPSELLKIVVYEPDEDLPRLLNEFVQKFVFIQADSGTESIDECRSRRNLLMGFCKQIMCGVFKIRTATDVFRHYVKYYNDYGDIIKMTLTKCRDINRSNFALTVEESLRTVFNEIFENKNGNVTSDDLSELVQLAKKLATFFTGNVELNKEPVLKLHIVAIQSIFGDGAIEGIVQRLPYFEVVQVFSSKLTAEQKANILKFLNLKTPTETLTTGPEWEFLEKYKSSLGSGTKNTTRTNPTPKSAARRATAPPEPEVQNGDDAPSPAKVKRKSRARNSKPTRTSTPVTAGTGSSDNPAAESVPAQTEKKKTSRKSTGKPASSGKAKAKGKRKSNAAEKQPMETD